MTKTGKLRMAFAFALVAGCNGQPAATLDGLTAAGPDARAQGVYGYRIDGADRVLLFDEMGVQLGYMHVSAPAPERRVLGFQLPDDTTDEIEVYGRTGDNLVGRVGVGTIATAVATDAALVPFLGDHGLRMRTKPSVRLNPVVGLATDTVVTTTKCVGTAPDHNLSTCTTSCDWNSNSPAGCARPGNLHAGCSNPSQLPAQIKYNNPADWADIDDGCAPSCPTDGELESYCAAAFGGLASDWAGKVQCQENGWDGFDMCYYLSYLCYVAQSENEWDASCPKQTCATSGYSYDQVPRMRDCNDPGSCTVWQGTVGCTNYH